MSGLLASIAGIASPRVSGGGRFPLTMGPDPGKVLPDAEV
jgi:hypothetical protein